MHRSRIIPLVAAAAAVLALTACGNDDGGDYSDNPVPVVAPPPLPGQEAAAPPALTTAPPPPPVAPVVPAGGALLGVREVSGLGPVVADAEGYTLYRFDQDNPRPPTPTCVAECATAWPPLVVDPEGPLSLEGVDRSVVGFVQRPDGSNQLTIAGWPVYRFAGDDTPGATSGHGTDGTWFAVTPAGGKAG